MEDEQKIKKVWDLPDEPIHGGNIDNLFLVTERENRSIAVFDGDTNTRLGRIEANGLAIHLGIHFRSGCVHCHTHCSHFQSQSRYTGERQGCHTHLTGHTTCV